MSPVKIVREPTDLLIPEVAKRLGRSYSWVYERLINLALEDCYRYRRDSGVESLYIRESGFRKLEDMHARAPRGRGRPRKVLVF
jgi:hypothetical protein